MNTEISDSSLIFKPHKQFLAPLILLSDLKLFTVHALKVTLQ